MTTPQLRLLDLFSGAGGAAMGYHQAGFQVTGIDTADHSHVYPFTFQQADALDTLRDTEYIQQFHAIHASPPCQAYSPLNAYNKVSYPDMIDEVRQLLTASRKPYIIENVVQAPLLNPIILCGQMFKLPIYRHRAFESNIPLSTPQHPTHTKRCTRNGYLPTPEAPLMSIHGGKHSRAWLTAATKAMEVMWMNIDDTAFNIATSIRGVCEAIPPAYTQHIGHQLATTYDWNTK